MTPEPKIPTDVLHEPRELLRRATQLSNQGSYLRRSPAPASLAPLREALRRLSALEKRLEGNPEYWRLRSLAEEVQLNYPLAYQYLRTAIQVGGSSKRDQKRLALLREQVREWKALRLSPTELTELGRFLREDGVGANSRNRTLTESWLDTHKPAEKAEILRALDDRGAFSDFQVLANIARSE